jgi:hypothetical protein
MSAHVRQFLDLYHKQTVGIVAETVTALGEDDALALVDIHSDYWMMHNAITCEHSEEAAGSLLCFCSLALPQKLLHLLADFLHARYEAVGRELRFIWEMVFRCRLADIEQAGATLDQKTEWLKAQERHLKWDTAVRPALANFFTDHDAVNTHFNAVWKRLNEVAHPSVNWLESGVGDSCRLVLDSFDERLARQTLADVGEVLALVWVVFLDAFPKIGPRLAAEPNLFKHTPQLRLFLPSVTTAVAGG